MALSKKMLLTILVMFLVVFFLFMALTVYGDILVSQPFVNTGATGSDAVRKLVAVKDTVVTAGQDAGEKLMQALSGMELPEAFWTGKTDADLEERIRLLENNGIRTGDRKKLAETLKQVSDEAGYLNGDAETRMNMILLEARKNEAGNKGVFTLQGKPGKVALYASDPESTEVRKMREWCILSKYAYRVFDAMPRIDQLVGYDLLLMADWPEDPAAGEQLESITRYGMGIFVAKLPDAEKLDSDPALANLFGIEKVVEKNMTADQIHLFADFYLSDERLWTRDDRYGTEDDMILEIPYFQLRSGYEVYAVAELTDEPHKGMPAEEMPPLMWQTVTNASRVCCMSTDVFAGDALPGTLSAFASQLSGVYVYPVVNARTIEMIGFPYMSRENDERVSSIYGHKADTLLWGVLWPGVMQAMTAYDQHADYCISECLDYTASLQARDRMAGYFTGQIQKQLGAMVLNLSQKSSVSLGEIIARNEAFVKTYVPEWNFTTLYRAGFTVDELLPYLENDKGLLGSVSLILQDKNPGDPLLETVGNNVLQVRLTSDGFRHEARDDIGMLAAQTVLALDNQYVDMTRVLYPEGDGDHWNNLSTVWSSQVTYYNDFSVFDRVQCSEMEKRARIMLSMDYDYTRTDHDIQIRVKGLEAGMSAYLILRLEQDVPTEITGGEMTKVIGGSYLIKADEPDVTIGIKPRFRLPGVN